MSKPRILIVEDSVINQKVLTKMIESMADVEVKAVQSAEEALESLERRAYQLVLMDVQLDGMNGLDATRAIREGHGRATPSTVPVAILSGYEESAYSDAARQAGATTYRLKPLESAELRELLKLAESAPF